MNKVIIITGASSGFGKATAERLAKRGHTVYGICRREMSPTTAAVPALSVCIKAQRQDCPQTVPCPNPPAPQ